MSRARALALSLAPVWLAAGCVVPDGGDEPVPDRTDVKTELVAYGFVKTAMDGDRCFYRPSGGLSALRTSEITLVAPDGAVIGSGGLVPHSQLSEADGDSCLFRTEIRGAETPPTAEGYSVRIGAWSTPVSEVMGFTVRFP